jgi:hypothetical protein
MKLFSPSSDSEKRIMFLDCALGETFAPDNAKTSFILEEKAFRPFGTVEYHEVGTSRSPNS